MKMNKYKVGDTIKCNINGITKYGIFTKIDNEYTGLIHISEISNKYIYDIKKLYVLDEEIECKIISIDNDKKQLKLSLKEINMLNNPDKILKEGGRGFEPLKENLDFWVEKKLKDIEKNKKIK